MLFRELLPERRPLPGAVELLAFLRDAGMPHGIATSGRRPEIDASLEALGVPAETVVVERGDVLRAKPEPDLFLACQERLGVAVRDCYVVGDAVWDLLAARRAGMLSVGLLSGGYGEDELLGAGAFRVYRDAADLHGVDRRARHLTAARRGRQRGPAVPGDSTGRPRQRAFGATLNPPRSRRMRRMTPTGPPSDCHCSIKRTPMSANSSALSR